MIAFACASLVCGGRKQPLEKQARRCLCDEEESCERPQLARFLSVSRNVPVPYCLPPPTPSTLKVPTYLAPTAGGDETNHDPNLRASRPQGLAPSRRQQSPLAQSEPSKCHRQSVSQLSRGHPHWSPRAHNEGVDERQKTSFSSLTPHMYGGLLYSINFCYGRP